MPKEDLTLLGIDYGRHNIGLALGKDGLTMPLGVVDARDIKTSLNRIGRLVVEHKISKIIVGLPLTANNKETAMSMETRRFAKMLKIQVKVPVEFVNEHASSSEALQEALATGLSQKARGTVDSIAAEIVLQRYYE